MRKINGCQIAADVREGMNDSELMQKYELSAKQLENVLRKLLKADLITHMQFYERTSLSNMELFWALFDWGQAARELD